jgi:hypothetical protein
MAVINEDAKNAASEVKKTRKQNNKQSISLTADELKQQTSDQIGALATSVTNPMMAAVKKTASQKIMLETVQAIPDILADADAGLADFFGSFEPEALAFDLTMNQLPQTAQLALKAA